MGMTSKHDKDCLRRRAVVGQFVCTCDMTDAEVRAVEALRVASGIPHNYSPPAPGIYQER